MSTHFPSYEDALSYLTMHDESAQRLDGLSSRALRATVTSERLTRKIVLLEGGQGDRDELVSEILALRYPLIAEARQVVSETVLRTAAEAGLDPKGAN